MEILKMQTYYYTPEALGELEKSGTLAVYARGYQSVGILDYIKMRKSMRLADALLKAGKLVPQGIKPEHEAKAKRKYPPGSRWITIHPSGNKEDKGVPVLIQDHGDGTAHVIGGASGRLNMMKLNNIKSPEEYKRQVQTKKEEIAQKKEEEERKRQEYLQSLSKQERKEVKQAEKQRKQAARAAEVQRKRDIEEAEKEYSDLIQEALDWDADEGVIEDAYEESKKGLEVELEQAVDRDDKQAQVIIKRELRYLDKAKKRAVKRQKKNLIAQAKAITKDFQKNLVEDNQLREVVEATLEESSEANDTIRKKLGAGLGFQKKYRETAEKNELTATELKAEKDKEFQKRLGEITIEHGPEVASFIEKGVQANRAINEITGTIYEKETFEKRITDLDVKTELLKKHLEFKRKMDALQKNKKNIKEIQVGLEVNPVEEVIDDFSSLQYGNGVKVETKPLSELLAEELQSTEERIKTERQSALNHSLLESIKENQDGSQKWIANGMYNGFNALSGSILQGEALPRDAVDILGVGNAAKLLAYQIKNNKTEEDYDDVTKGVELYHQEINEEIVQGAVEKGRELLERAQSIELDIANNPEDLALIRELNDQKLAYIDEANRIMGQALGSLEASSALAMELKKEEFTGLDVNFGKISSEEAIIRMRALGLDEKDYEFMTIKGERIAKIQGEVFPKMIENIEPGETQLREEVSAIKAGAEDKEGWLPPGVISRPVETFEDPGPNASLPSGHVDNQEIENSEKTVEAIHRTLGELPEGQFAFKQVDDLSSEEQNALRKYWENTMYKGSQAEKTATKEYQTGKGKSRTGLWSGFLHENGGSKEFAFEAIKEDLIENHSSEDMFGNKEVPSLAKVVQDQWETYRGLPDAKELFQAIDSLQSDLDKGYVEEKSAAEKELEKMRSELPSKLSELYEAQMRDHYIKHMSGATEAELQAGETREDRSPWGEFVRMFGGPKNAQEAVLDRIKGEFVGKYTTNHGKILKEKLQTDVRKIRHDTDYVLGMLDKESRDRYLERADRIMKQYEAQVGRGTTGKFVSGSRRDKAAELWRKDQAEEAKQGALFGGEDIKQDDGTEILHIGKRAEAQLASMIPEVAVNHTLADKYYVSPGLSMSGKHIEQQRAIRMLETTKKMNLSFGTGKGKSLISLGAFANLKNKGKVSRALYAVPSVVQKQFGSEGQKFLEPGKFRWSAQPGMSREERIAAYKNGKLDMVVMTHQSLRDDMVHLMSQKLGKGEEDTKKYFNALSPRGQKEYLRDTLKQNSINFDMLTVDESHYEVDRKNKEDSTLSNILSALGGNTDYLLRQSATPVKNDVSEAFSMLQKVDPEKFNNRDEFIKRYGVDSDFAKKSLQRLIDRYNYASPTVTGVHTNHHEEKVSLTPVQKKEYEKVGEMYQRARKAHRSGKVDIEAMRFLSPSSFGKGSSEKNEEIARKLQQSVGIIKCEAQNRIIHQFDHVNNAKVRKATEIVKKKKYREGEVGKAGEQKPGIIFAHNLKAVSGLRDALKKEGLRVGIIQGSLNGKEKEKIKNAFNPPSGKSEDREYDVLVLSDAGATGLNLQNSAYVINYDIPDTDWVLKQRNGRADRHGALHPEIDYHNIISDTDYDTEQWERVKRKEKLGEIFSSTVDPAVWDDTGVSERIARVRQDRINQGLKVA